MRLVLVPVLALLTACAATPAGAPPRKSFHEPKKLAVLVGARALDEDDHDPVDEQNLLGVEVQNVPWDGGIGWELGLAASADDGKLAGVEIEGATGEVYGGVRGSIGSGIVRPYLGTGLAFVTVSVDPAGGDSEHDNSLAGYAHGGVLLVLSPKFAIGVDVRALFGSELELAGLDKDADYEQVALVLMFEI